MKRGSKSTIDPAVEAEMERLWVHTAISREDIARHINDHFGTAFEPRNVEWIAKRRGWAREVILRSSTNPVVVEERLFTQSWLRWADAKPADNPVRRVAPGTYPANGFRMGER